MAIDPRIALGVQPMQFQQQDPNAGMNALARMMQVSSAMDEQRMNSLKFQELQRGVDETNKLNTIYGGAVGPDGTIDRTKLFGGLASGNLGSRIPGIQKQLLEADTAQATLGKTKAEQAKLELEAGIKKTEHVASVLSQATPANWGTVRSVVKNTYGMDLPEQFDPRFVQTEVAKGQTLTERLKAEHDRLTLEETARNNRATTGLGYAKLGEDKRHHGIVESQGAQTVAQGAVEYKQDANGQWMALPKKGAVGPVQAQTVTGPGGQPLPTKNEVSAKNALGIISEAEKLIDGATGSYLGAGYDVAAQAFGKATPGAVNTAKLKALEGALMMAQPRMEGPQSDKDVALYRQMAAQIGDPTVPGEMKKAALQTVKELHQRYAPEQKAAPPTPQNPASPKVPRLSAERADAEYNALPSGATFIGPDGKTRRKP